MCSVVTKWEEQRRLQPSSILVIAAMGESISQENHSPSHTSCLVLVSASASSFHHHLCTCVEILMLTPASALLVIKSPRKFSRVVCDYVLICYSCCNQRHRLGG